MRKIFASLPYWFLFSLLAVTAVHAEDRYFPYVLAEQEVANIADKVDGMKQSLLAGGFEIAGEYSPIRVRSFSLSPTPILKKRLPRPIFGGFGAGVRYG